MSNQCRNPHPDGGIEINEHSFDKDGFCNYCGNIKDAAKEVAPEQLWVQIRPMPPSALYAIAAYTEDPREVHDNGKPVYEYVRADIADRAAEQTKAEPAERDHEFLFSIIVPLSSSERGRIALRSISNYIAFERAAAEQRGFERGRDQAAEAIGDVIVDENFSSHWKLGHQQATNEAIRKVRALEYAPALPVRNDRDPLASTDDRPAGLAGD